jgi:flagellin
MRINNNVMAFNAQRNLNVSTSAMGKSVEKLSSGLRINRAADDAAGLFVSQRLRGQVASLRQASRNAQDGISLVQTAEGALNEVHNMLTRMRELTVQARNGTNTDAAIRTAILAEVNQLGSEIDRIATTTRFNGVDAFAGITLHVGADAGATNQITVGTTTPPTIGAVAWADDAAVEGFITTVNGYIDTVSTNRATLGASQNRLESTVNNLSVTVENLIAAESRIRDTDMAAEMVNFTRFQIMNQAGTAMVGQANALPQSILSLLR